MAVQTRSKSKSTVAAPLPAIQAADLLGGPKVLRRSLIGPFAAHDMLLDGLPSAALVFLIDNLRVLQMAGLEKAAGMSLRTVQRRSEANAKPLSPEQSGRVWKFAEILAKAIKVFGTQHAAEQWLESPALGLDQRRPIDLLATPAGVAQVEMYLGRIEYGVYT